MAQEKLNSFRQRCWRHLVRGFDTVDQVLRRSGDRGRETIQNSTELTTPNHGHEIVPLLSIGTVIRVVLISGPIYGFAMGSYAAVVGERSWPAQFWQMAYSAAKVPLLLALTLMISIPSFFVINSLLGLRDDFSVAVRAIVSAQAGMTIILCSLLPLILFGYCSLAATEAGYSAAVLSNAIAFGTASITAQLLLRAYYQPLVQRDRRHRWMIRFWIVIYAFVGIQAGYILRPFVGSPDQPTTFLRRESFQNAYVKIIELIGNTLGW